MKGHYDIGLFLEELEEVTRSYRKNAYIPSCIMIKFLTNLCEEFDIMEEDTSEIINLVNQEGYITVQVAEENFVSPESSEEELKQKVRQMLEEANYDLDTLYYMGATEYLHKEDPVIDEISNIVFFWRSDLGPGKKVSIETSKIIDKVCRDYHFSLFPEDFERTKGWVDQNVISMIQPFVKNGYYPYSIYENVYRSLLIQYGNRVLCENIIARTCEEMRAVILATPENFVWSPTSDKATIEKRFEETMLILGIDGVKVHQRGGTIIDADSKELLRNSLFFNDINLSTLSAAREASRLLLVKISAEIYYREIDEEPAFELKSDEELRLLVLKNCKGNYVPRDILGDYFDQMICKYGNVENAARIYHHTLDELSIKDLPFNSTYRAYELPEDADLSDLLPFVHQRLRLWNLEAFNFYGNIPEDCAKDFLYLSSLIYFSDFFDESYENAKEYVKNALNEEIIHYQRSHHPEKFPIDVLEEISSELKAEQRYGYIPTFRKSSYVRKIYQAMPEEINQYSRLVYLDILNDLSLKEIGLVEDDLFPPCDNEDELTDEIINRILQLNPDFNEYIQTMDFECSTSSEFITIANAALYASPVETTWDDMYSKCLEILYAIGEEYIKQNAPEQNEGSQIVVEYLQNYVKNQLVPSFLADEIESAMRHKGIAEIRIENEMNSYHQAVTEGHVLQLEKKHWLSEGASERDIVRNILTIANEYGKSIQKICDEIQTFHDQKNRSGVTKEIEHMVFFADDQVDSVEEASGRILQILSNL